MTSSCTFLLSCSAPVIKSESYGGSRKKTSMQSGLIPPSFWGKRRPKRFIHSTRICQESELCWIKMQNSGLWAFLQARSEPQTAASFSHPVPTSICPLAAGLFSERNADPSPLQESSPSLVCTPPGPQGSLHCTPPAFLSSLISYLPGPKGPLARNALITNCLKEKPKKQPTYDAIKHEKNRLRETEGTQRQSHSLEEMSSA